MYKVRLDMEAAGVGLPGGIENRQVVDSAKG
jgi:hypothetical protein